ncbi:MAG: YfhO family protein [Ferruginibacter sp.]
MKPINFKKLLPHLIAVGVFLIVAVLYCKPALEGKVLNQHDTVSWRAMAQQSFEVKEKTGYFPLWTNSMFSGMPAYQIALDPRTHINDGLSYFSKAISLGLPEPINYFFLAAICFYFLCLVMGVSPWAAMIGGLAYAYATYNPVIITVGHNTKMLSMAYAPAVLAGLHLIFSRKFITGFVVTALFAAVMIAQNHLQIVYYTLLIAAAMWVVYLVKAIREKTLMKHVIGSFIALGGGLIGLGANAVFIMPTYEYAKETMRGGVSQLTLDKEKDGEVNKTKGGLDKDYALRWSLGKMESFVVMVPGLYGGSNGGNEHKTSVLSEDIPEENALGMTNAYSYWGSMSASYETTSGPPYLGAVVCFLFIIGLFFVNGPDKWWILAATATGLLLAWGSNLQFFNYFILDHLPFYSKFRAPSMAMVITQLTIPLLGVLAVNRLLSWEMDMAGAWKKFKYGLYTAGGIMLLLGLFYMMADYTGKADTDIKENIKQSILRQVPQGQPVPPQLAAQADDTSKKIIKGIREDRKNLLGGDLLRTLLFLLIAGALTWLIVRKKISPVIYAASILVLTGIDLLGVDSRYMNYDRFTEAEEVANEFNPTEVDKQILKDPDHANFRVFNETVNFSSESITSYHHNSIGGYSPAKLGLYQDLIEHQIVKNNPQVLNMLNTRYFILPDREGRPYAQLNPFAYGNCWLVKGIKYVNSPNNEMLALDSTDLRDTAVVNESFKAAIKQQPQYDSAAVIKLKDRQNDAISYTFTAPTPQFAVFSEVYYSEGWNAYIDGQKTDYVKTNYILRGLYVPAGSHTIDFKFEPASFTTGRTITIWSCILIYVMLLASIGLFFLRRKNNTASAAA